MVFAFGCLLLAALYFISFASGKCCGAKLLSLAVFTSNCQVILKQTLKKCHAQKKKRKCKFGMFSSTGLNKLGYTKWSLIQSGRHKLHYAKLQ